MSITIQNIPFFCLLWIGIGFIFVLIGIFQIASHNESDNHYIEFGSEKSSPSYDKEVSELFSFFLEEEEKKNQDLRDMLREAVNEKSDNGQSQNDLISKSVINSINKSHLVDDPGEIRTSETNVQRSIPQPSVYNEIIKLYEEGTAVEEIAKKLKKGVGEVNLMISLYTMR